jgi:tetratricopeptide (TPR) repeat protein
MMSKNIINQSNESLDNFNGENKAVAEESDVLEKALSNGELNAGDELADGPKIVGDMLPEESAVEKREAGPLEEVGVEESELADASEQALEAEAIESGQPEDLPTEAQLLLEPAQEVDQQPELPWWQRLFARKLKEKEKDVLSPSKVISEFAGEESTSTVQQATTAQGATMPLSVGEPALAWSEAEPMPPDQPPAGEAPVAPAFTLEDVRVLIQNELALTQADIARAVQAEVARVRQDRRQASLALVNDAAEAFYTSKVETTRLEMDILKEQERITLADRVHPFRERMEELDYIRERMARIEQDFDEHKKVAARSAAESAQLVDELEGRTVATEFRQELERQKAAVAAVPEMVQQTLESRLAEFKPFKRGGLGLWPTLVGLLLVAVVGVAGIILPRSAGGGDIYVELAALYQADGQTRQAQTALERAQEAGISAASAWANAGETYRLLGKYDLAVSAYTQAVRREPGNVDYLIGLARSLGNSGKRTEAIAQYQKAIDAAPPGKDWIFVEMGAQYAALKSYDQALAQYQRALELNTNSVWAYYYTGEVYRALGKTSEAESAYRKAIELKADNYTYYISLAQLLLEQQKYDAALEPLQNARELVPERPEAYFYLGEVYLGQGSYGLAIEQYKQAITLNPKASLYQAALGDAYRAQGDCASASLAYNAALALNPKEQRAIDGLAACAGQ